METTNIINTMIDIRKISNTLNGECTQEELTKGLAVSKLVTEQPQEVAMTPIFKNALKKFDKFEEGQRLKVNDAMTKAEKYFYESAKKMLASYGPKQEEYNRSLPSTDFNHYLVDCYRNLKENMRHIQPGQAEKRAEIMREYRKPSNKTDIIALLRTDRIFQKAVSVLLDYLNPYIDGPMSTKAATFESRYANSGWKWFTNTKNVNPETGRKVMDEAFDYAKKCTPKEAAEIVWMLFGRNQRGKGRALEAMSKISTIYFSQVAHPMSNAQRDSLWLKMSRLSPAEMKNEMFKLSEAAPDNYCYFNDDYKGYDASVPGQMVLLMGAILEEKAKSAKAKKLIKYLAASAVSPKIIDGTSGKLERINGRHMSGYPLTFEGGSFMNAVMMLYALMKTDKDWYKVFISLANKGLLPFNTAGDDNMKVMLNGEKYHHDVAELMKKTFNIEIHPDKGEFGLFFLQWRAFKDGDKECLAYAITRVLIMLLFKEHSVGLGPMGWGLAFYQAFEKVLDVPQKMFNWLVNLILPFDEMQLMTKLTPKQIKERLAEEDKEVSGKQGRKSQSTAEKLYKGNPQDGMFSIGTQGEVEISLDWITKINTKIKSAIAP